jgi:toxin FitB
MILLDTAVLSALMHPIPEPLVIAWLDRQSPREIWTGSVNVFEIEFGLNLMPPGKRRSHLESALAGLLADDLRGQVLDFDARAAGEAGKLMAKRKREGRDYKPLDAMIAGIAITRRATIATRNVKHFDDLPVSVVNPWQA